MALGPLLRPRTIAVIGGGVWCRNVIEQCRKIGFKGEIWPVHPARNEVGGLTAFRSVVDLPDAPDAAFVGVNRDATLDVVQSLSARGAGGAVCFASGFRETADGADRQAALLEAAGDMPILGPNCYGFLNYLDGVALWPDQHGGTRVERGVAIIAQSSNIALNLTMQTRGLPLAYVITVGNQAQTGLSDIAMEVLQDDRVTALGLYVEGIDDLRRFEAMASEAHRLGKSVVAVKVGASDEAQATAVSHTASLVGSDVGARALLQRLGVGQAGSLSVFLEALKLLHLVGPLRSNRVASMSCSGGEASLMADVAHGSGLVFPPLSAAQEDGLSAALGARVTLANPLDYHTYIWGDVEAMAATFTAMMQGDLAMGCVVLDLPRGDRCDPSAWEPTIAAVAKAREATGVPMAVVASLSEAMPEALAQRLMSQGLVPFCGMAEAVAAMDIAAAMGGFVPADALVLMPPTEAFGETVSEAEAKAVLSEFGLRVPKSARTTSAVGAADAAEAIGFPVVLKGEGVAHKTEAGAVALNLGSRDAVQTGAEAMQAETFLVEEMVRDAVAELLIGVVADPAHGYVLTLGAGGTMTELMRDSASCLLPVEREDVRALLARLRIAAVLDGYRGGTAANVDAVVDAVMAVQAYVTAHRPLEVEINPLLCGHDGAVAADALIRTGERK